MAQRLRTHATLIENSNLFTDTHTKQFITTELQL